MNDETILMVCADLRLIGLYLIKASSSRRVNGRLWLFFFVVFFKHSSTDSGSLNSLGARLLRSGFQ